MTITSILFYVFFTIHGHVKDFFCMRAGRMNDLLAFPIIPFQHPIPKNLNLYDYLILNLIFFLQCLDYEFLFFSSLSVLSSISFAMKGCPYGYANPPPLCTPLYVEMFFTCLLTSQEHLVRYKVAQSCWNTLYILFCKPRSSCEFPFSWNYLHTRLKFQLDYHHGQRPGSISNDATLNITSQRCIAGGGSRRY